MAGLLVVASRATRDAGVLSVSAILATQKIEQLRSLTFGYDAAGLPASDTTTDLASAPERGGGAGLTPSPPGSLRDDVPGYFDLLDNRGRVVAGVGPGFGTAPQPAYIRRWSIDALPGGSRDALLLQVLVTRWRPRAPAAGAGTLPRLPDEAMVETIRSRSAP